MRNTPKRVSSIGLFKAAEIANFERLAPTIMQIPGIDPSWFAKEAIRRLDDGLDLTEAIKAAIPSIVAQNAMQQAQQEVPQGVAEKFQTL